MLMPNKEQAGTLVRFAETHGRSWRDNLRSHRMGGPDFALERDRPLLRQVRNECGPDWLNRISLAELKEVAQ